MLKIGIIIGSTRPGRKSDQVAKWYYDIAKSRSDAEFDIIDLAEVNLPLYDEPIPAGYHDYQNEHTKKWAEKIAPYDGFVIVTAEYNHSIPAVLKNALDYLYYEWNNKAVAFVSYGSSNGVRAVNTLRLIAGEMQMADVRQQVMFSIFTDFDENGKFLAPEGKEDSVKDQLNQLIPWAKALKSVRENMQ